MVGTVMRQGLTRSSCGLAAARASCRLAAAGASCRLAAAGFSFRLYSNLAPAKPVITIPVKVQQRAVKRHKNLRLLTRDMDKQQFRAAPLVIASKRPEFHHYRSQTYGVLQTLKLASGGWHNRKSYGDYFTINPFKAPSANSFAKGMETAPKFSDYEKLDPRIAAALSVCGFLQPTNIQHETLSSTLASEDHALIASETGNGKTLCFLIPMIQNILHIKEANQNRRRRLNAPYGVVLAPTRELAVQIGEAARGICAQLGLTVIVQLGGSIKQKILRGQREEVDLLVGSVGGLAKLFHEGHNSAANVCEVALDEIDTLLDDTFKDSVMSLLRKFGQSGQSLLTGVRLYMAGATFPTNFNQYMSEIIEVENVQKFATKDLHRVQAHVPQKFIRVAPSSKPEILRDLLEKDGAKKKKTLIFSNKASTCGFVSMFLNENNIKCIYFDQNVHWRYRQRHLDEFLIGDTNVLSATDLASRGLDTQQVQHVINYDFPLNPADYIHRAGRVGRVGANGCGHVTSLVDSSLGVDVLQRIETSVRKNAEIRSVNNNIIRIIEHRHRKKLGLPPADEL